MEQRAICIGVPVFGASDDGARPGGDEEWGAAEKWMALPFAFERTQDLASALEAHGYTCSIPPPDRLTAIGIGQAVRRVTSSGAPEDVVIVHVLSHGVRADRTGKLYVVGSDGTHHGLSEVESWLSHVEDFTATSRTLFLLDLCHAGAAARYSWQMTVNGGPVRAWVIAGAAPLEAALNGRFTLAVAQVLRALKDGELDVHRTYEYVPLGTIAQEVKRRVLTLAEESHGLRQSVTASMVDISAEAASQPFFANPHYGRTESDILRLGLDSALCAFIDDMDPDSLLDPPHFLEQAAGRGALRNRVHLGCFTGRRRQLADLDGWCARSLESTGICVVTGSPGTGKSALLGLIVCATHPRIRSGSRTVWERVLPNVVENPFLAAAHARQRALPHIVSSLSQQLGLNASMSTPEEFCSTVATMPQQPVVVIDALDEAADPTDVMNNLLLPLVGTQRPDGRPACRLIVGTRPWPHLQRLRYAALEHGVLIDLDAVPHDVLRTDLAEYVERLTANCLPYRDEHLAAMRKEFSMSVARTLTERTDAEAQRWGEFLVAGLYTHYVIDQLAPVRSLEEARGLGAEVPRTLPDVLQLDLRRKLPNRLIRPVLAVLGYARGNGIPLETIRRMASALLPNQNGTRRITVEQVQEALELGRFYLRTAPDTDASTLYRLFHQGLADHLRANPLANGIPAGSDLPGKLLDRLLAPLPINPAGHITGWGAARPYTLRHTIQHASEAGRADDLLVMPEFLIHADPVLLFPELDHVKAPEARVCAIVYRTSVRLHRYASPRTRQQVLAIDAARCHANQLSRELSSVPTSPPVSWRPTAVRAGDADPEPNGTDAACTEDVFAVADTVIEGRRVIVSGHGDGTVRLWDLKAGKQWGPTLRGHTEAVRSIACAEWNGRPVAVSGGADHQAIVWDLSLRRKTGASLRGHTDWVRGVCFARLPDRLLVVTAGADNTVGVWDLDDPERGHTLMTGHRAWVRAVVCTQLDGRPVAVSASADSTIRIWDLERREPLYEPITGHEGAVRAVACTRVDGRSVVVSGGADGTIRLWDLRTREAVGNPMTGHPGGVWTLACGAIDDTPVAVAGSTDGSLRTWNLHTERLLYRPVAGHHSWVADLAAVQTPERVMTASASGDGSVRIWDTASGEPCGPALSVHPERVTGLACVSVRGRTAVAAALSDGWLRSFRPDDGTSAARTFRTTPTGPRYITALHGPRESILVTGTSDGDVRFWDPETGVPVGRPRFPRLDGLVALAARGDGVLVTGTRDGRVRYWDVMRGSPADLPPIPRQDGLIALAMVAPGTLVMATEAGEIHCWDTERGTPGAAQPVPPHEKVVALAANNRGMLAVAFRENRIRLWDLPTGKLLDTLTLPTAIGSLALTDDEHMAVALGWEIVFFRHHQ